MRISDWSSDVCSSDLEVQKGLSEFGTTQAVGRDIMVREIGRLDEELVDAGVRHKHKQTEDEACSRKAIDRQPASHRDQRIGEVLEQDRKSTRLNSSH